ncbi:LysM peptidoglycan-binding domain-containing protein [Thiothrix lacustris]|uniref:LysM peptidoglycan-binding domain-containing protein n=1 Tax=Thiothrix lacustris TaxID=525917 RepID=UPI0027E5A48E|nr:LysM peptidoglycan-binding domain-containing protein [Thiothrix lacustris]WMP18765.1 LysM peptidoglycan-binding domain-containing protein [Thiothrix lacustris]
MKIRNIIVTTLASVMMIAMTGSAFAKEPAPVQQKAVQSTTQHTPAKVVHKAVQQKAHKSASKAKTIRVRKGDTLSHIAHAHHISVARLKRLNHLKSDKIMIGQVLRIR